MKKKEIDNLYLVDSIDGARITNSYGTFRTSRKNIGLLRLNSGQIIIADPLTKYQLEDMDRRTLSIAVEPGNYPVEIYMADDGEDCFPAFAGVRFNDNSPVEFIAAKTVHDQKQSRRPPYRYVVNECRTGFVDAYVFRRICSLPKYALPDNLIDFDDTEDNGYRCVVGCSEDGELTAALVTVRKSGVYYWYWGKDRDGAICCLMADFFTYQ